ncbi:MAG: Hpt domain-containing protein [Acidobacteriaceae bacterium]|nr:Hpt domain-containing protein [Acidobacteriaceae bacterium]
MERPVTKLPGNVEARDRIDRLRILLVEWDERRGDQLLSVLTAAGHCAVRVPDLDEATEALATERFDSVLLGSGQSVQSSADFVSKLRNIEAGQRSGSRATVLGCSPLLQQSLFLDGSLPDEFDTECLGETLSRSSAAIPGTAAPSESGGCRYPVFERDQFEEQCANETGFMIEIIDLFSAEQDRELPEMAQALAEADFERLSRLAHTLKGSLAALHASLAWHRAQSIERASRDQNRVLCAELLHAFGRDLAELNELLSGFRQACLCS